VLSEKLRKRSFSYEMFFPDMCREKHRNPPNFRKKFGETGPQAGA